MAITGSCHCGNTAFTIDAPLPETLTRCTCSICAKRGALYAYFEPAQFSLTRSLVGDSPQAGSADKVYRWNTKMVANHFCSECGCSTYNDSPAFELDGKWDGITRRIGVNARLFDAFEAEDAPVKVIDGRHLW